ncbi:putative abc transporter atp-binding protein [Bordetella holmesii 41130]|nr:putative abc transporter atp-binding protein [Bordetella holmesii 41130]
MISTANLTIQFGPKPLFENVSVKFGEGNRYGLIGPTARASPPS